MTDMLANDLANPAPRPTATTVRAQALAEVRQMQTDLETANETIGQLRADLAREQDRVILALEERARYRAEANTYRALLATLAANQTNIGLICTKAESIMLQIDAIMAADTPKDDEPHKTPPPVPPNLADEIARATLESIAANKEPLDA